MRCDVILLFSAIMFSRAVKGKTGNIIADEMSKKQNEYTAR
jgi:hypothetical protein